MLKWRASLYSPLRMFSITRGLLEFRPSPSSCALSMHPVEVFLSNTISAALDNVWTECIFEPLTSLHPVINVANHETTKRKFTPSWIACPPLSQPVRCNFTHAILAYALYRIARQPNVCKFLGWKLICCCCIVVARSMHFDVHSGAHCTRGLLPSSRS